MGPTAALMGPVAALVGPAAATGQRLHPHRLRLFTAPAPTNSSTGLPTIEPLSHPSITSGRLMSRPMITPVTDPLIVDGVRIDFMIGLPSPAMIVLVISLLTGPTIGPTTGPTTDPTTDPMITRGIDRTIDPLTDPTTGHLTPSYPSRLDMAETGPWTVYRVAVVLSLR